MNNVFGEILQIKEFLAFLLQLPALAAEGLGEQAGEVSHCQKAQKIHDQPGTKALRNRQSQERARNLSQVSEKSHCREQKKTNRGGEESNSAGEENTGDDNDQQVEGDEIALLETCRIDQQGNHQHIAGHLEAAMPARLRNPSQEDEMKESYSEDERDRQQTNARQPLKPFPCCEVLIHCLPAPLPQAIRASPGPGGKSGGPGVPPRSLLKRRTPRGRKLD